MIGYGRQDITREDVEAVTAALQSDFLTQGPAVPAFEAAVAAKVGVTHAVAVSNATAALHVACMALGLGPGDTLWTAPNTFVASSNCARYCGAQVDFVDIDSKTWNMSLVRLKEKLAAAKRQGRLPKIVVPVHFAGQPTDQEDIWALSKEYGFKVIEDAAHAIGASRNGEPVGSCRWSHITVFSFHPVKIITTGEGGLAATNDPELAWRMALLRSHGITREPDRLTGRYEGPWYYEQQELGFNYRMTDIQAALGASQLNRLEYYVARRNDLARRYDRLLAGLPLRLPMVMAGNISSFHLYVVRVVPGLSPRTRGQVFDLMRARDIGVNVHYTPVHLQPYYRTLGFEPDQFPEAENHGREAITLPLYPTLTDEQQDRVVLALREAFAGD